MPGRRQRRENLRPVVTFDRDAVLDLAHLAAALGVSEETAAKGDWPSFAVGGKQRYLWGQVLDEAARRADPTYERNSRLKGQRVG
jgi:hypothetical protein